MGTPVVVLGVLGLVVAAAGLIDLCIHAVRRRQFLDIAVVFSVAALAVWLLIEYGHVLLQ